MTPLTSAESRRACSYTPHVSAPPPPERRPHRPDGRPVHPVVHLLAGAWVAAALLTAALRPDAPFLLGEDGLIEWWTVTLYGAAGVLMARQAIRHRRPFDGLVALFCLFVAGEEFSWGQRLLGYQPPAFFLERNIQQEANLHNLVSAREILSYALLGFGVVLPTLWRFDRSQRLMRLVGASAPPLALAPWFVAAVVLVQWDPTRITGEWAECLAGALFVAATWRPGQSRWPVPAVALVGAAALTVAGSRGSDAEHLACAEVEAAALLDDLTSGALDERVLGRGTAFKRVWSAAGAGELDLSRARAFMAARCDGAPGSGAAERRRFAVDPWGNPYHVAVERSGGAVRVHVHSSGPNRRRDSGTRLAAGDDVAASAAVVAGMTEGDGS
jgi:hypothetical protein